ncbi:hypothetical protein [Marilutibacter chinensis]|uniref:hypothetical protein n=1 Tax=Marilutibacter chinensis TaxID=2912247 RepID=UPI001F397ECD|nr:hypothetical protein [Lysobacter chinensis]
MLTGLLAVGALLALPAPAAGQIRRCTAADGTSVFTDRRCEDVDSVSRRPDAGASTGRSGLYRPRCMRSIDELVFELGLAFDSQDANRLAGLYHWAGMSSSSGYAVIERLDRLVHRPLIGFVPIMPAPPDPMPLPTPVPASMAERGAAGDTSSPSPATTGDWTDWGRPLPSDPEPPPSADPPPASPAPPEPSPTSTPPPQRPVALRIEQTLSDGSTPSSTVFGLTRHFGCWWLRD